MYSDDEAPLYARPYSHARTRITSQAEYSDSRGLHLPSTAMDRIEHTVTSSWSARDARYSPYPSPSSAARHVPQEHRITPRAGPSHAHRHSSLPAPYHPTSRTGDALSFNSDIYSDLYGESIPQAGISWVERMRARSSHSPTRTYYSSGFYGDDSLHPDEDPAEHPVALGFTSSPLIPPSGRLYPESAVPRSSEDGPVITPADIDTVYREDLHLDAELTPRPRSSHLLVYSESTAPALPSPLPATIGSRRAPSDAHSTTSAIAGPSSTSAFLPRTDSRSVIKTSNTPPSPPHPAPTPTLPHEPAPGPMTRKRAREMAAAEAPVASSSNVTVEQLDEAERSSKRRRTEPQTTQPPSKSQKKTSTRSTTSRRKDVAPAPATTRSTRSTDVVPPGVDANAASESSDSNPRQTEEELKAKSRTRAQNWRDSMAAAFARLQETLPEEFHPPPQKNKKAPQVDWCIAGMDCPSHLSL